MFYLIVTADETLVKKARECGAGVFTASKSPVMESTVDPEESMHSKAYHLIRTLAINPNLNGYEIIKYLMKKCMADANYHKLSVTNVIYPECASVFNTLPMRVERVIRHALKRSYETVPEKYNELFGYELGRAPTNSKFISMASEYLNTSYK